MKTRLSLQGRTRGLPTLLQAVATWPLWAGAATAQQPTAPIARAHPSVAAVAVTAAAAPVSAALPAGAIEHGVQLVQQAARALAPPGARVLVTAGAPDARLRLAPCAAASAHLLPGAPAWGATRFGVRCTQGARWSIQVPVQVQAWSAAVVAAVALPAGTVLTTHQLSLAEVDWAAHAAPQAAPGAALAGLPAPAALFAQAADIEARKLARPLAPGEPVRALDLHTQQWFAAGQTVSLVAIGDGFAVASEGQALSPGLQGQLVRVRTDSGRVVTGQAVGQRRVELRL